MREFLAKLFFGDIREIARLSAENNVLNLRVETLAADNEILRQRLDRLMDIIRILVSKMNGTLEEIQRKMK